MKAISSRHPVLWGGRQHRFGVSRQLDVEPHTCVMALPGFILLARASGHDVTCRFKSTKCPKATRLVSSVAYIPPVCNKGLRVTSW